MTVVKFRRRKARRRRRSVLGKFIPTKGTAGLIATGLVLVVAVANPAERFPEHVPWLVKATASRTVDGAVTKVRDGDTIEVKGVPVRLGSLDCAELATPEGRAAKTAMQVLVSGNTVSCHLDGSRSYDRWIGHCFRSDGQELASAMMQAGYCRRYW
ncbi:thermonuclease family protein [Paracoccus salsus]|uniref:thermonuclease family protein n=1 Tax=Paracoccus salsus TaxID=2911061 RepID=UPI001F1B9FE7|nr:hypothetical protein [Paracoccus salsus]MCF3973928.1 hypothetical protein [Paracoccus salsus]